MTKKTIIKFVSLLMLVTVLTSIFSLPVFAEAESSDEVNNDEELLFEDLPWWEQALAWLFMPIFMILLILTAFIAPIVSIIQTLIPEFADLWASIVNFFAGLW